MKLTELILTICLIGLLASMLAPVVAKVGKNLSWHVRYCGMVHNSRLAQAMDESEKFIPDLDRGLRDGDFQKGLKW